MSLSPLTAFKPIPTRQPYSEIPISVLQSDIWSMIIPYLDFKTAFISLKLTGKAFSDTVPFNELFATERMKQCYLKGISPRYLVSSRSIPFIDHNGRNALYTPSEKMHVLFTRASQLNENDPLLEGPQIEALVLHYDADHLQNRIAQVEQNILTLSTEIIRLQRLSTPLGKKAIDREIESYRYRIQELQRQLQQLPDTSASMAQREVLLKNLERVTQLYDGTQRVHAMLSLKPEEVDTLLKEALQKRETLENEKNAIFRHLHSFRKTLKMTMENKLCLLSIAHPMEIEKQLWTLDLVTYGNIPEVIFANIQNDNLLNAPEEDDGGNGEELSAATLRILKERTQLVQDSNTLRPALLDLSTPQTPGSIATCVALIAYLGQLHEEAVLLSLKINNNTSPDEAAQINQEIEDSKSRIHKEKEEIVKQLANHGLDLAYITVQVNLENGQAVNRGCSLKDLPSYSSSDLKALGKHTVKLSQQIAHHIQIPIPDMMPFHLNIFKAQLMNALEVLIGQVFMIDRILKERGINPVIMWSAVLQYTQYPITFSCAGDDLVDLEDDDRKEDDDELPSLVRANGALSLSSESEDIDEGDPLSAEEDEAVEEEEAVYIGQTVFAEPMEAIEDEDEEG